MLSQQHGIARSHTNTDGGMNPEANGASEWKQAHTLVASTVPPTWY